MLAAHEVRDALTARHEAQDVRDLFGGLQKPYSEFQEETRLLRRIYANDFEVVWPDGQVSRGLPKVANFMQLAADDRSREVSSTMPTITCPTYGRGDKVRIQAEKRERIAMGYLDRSHVGLEIPMWAYDAMAGFAAVKVWPDFSKSRTERYPMLTRLDPMYCFPDPIFSRGPLDSFIYAYDARVANIEKRFGTKLGFANNPALTNERATVIEYWDDTQYIAVVEGHVKQGYSQAQHRALITVAEERHDMGVVPVAVAARPQMDGVYRSEFMGGVGVTNTLNRLITMMLDDAFQKVYAPTMSYDVENPEEGGPGGHLVAQSDKARFEWIQPPNQPFTNLQIVRDLTGAARSANLIPPARSGDPNESIISAAGISATQSQFNSDVRNIQDKVIAPLLERAVEIAFAADEKWCEPPKGQPKEIYNTGRDETYVPSKDIGGLHRVKVIYGMRAGLDPINQGVMVLQQRGAELISKRTSLELSPFVEDPVAEEKQMLLENIDAALTAGLIQQAGTGALDVATLAHIRKMVADEDTSLTDALEMHAPLAPAPLAAPASTPGAAPSQAPGVAGAAEGQALPQNLPPLAELLGG